jgi:hypothetical protein
MDEINDFVKKMEQNNPEMCAEFKKILQQQYELFCMKMNDYGKGNIMLGGDIENINDRKYALMGTTIRLNDKTNRLINLVLKKQDNAVSETIEDTFQDIINYGIISLIVNRGKWK